MPIYEYRCRSCGALFETLVRRSDEAVRCPECGADAPEKRISAHAVGAAAAPEPGCASGACAPAIGCGAGACPACE